MRSSIICATNIMEVQPDFRELLALFNAYGVDYTIVSGYALAYYGAPRFPAALDIFVKPDLENARRIIAALPLSALVPSVYLKKILSIRKGLSSSGSHRFALILSPPSLQLPGRRPPKEKCLANMEM